MHDVEAAGVKAEIERLDVDDHFVADLRASHERDIGDRLAAPGGVDVGGELDH